MKPSPYPWAHVRRSLRLFAVDPVGLGGIVLRARAGPARDVCVATLPDLGLPHQRLHPSLTDAELFASMDFAATLAKGQQIYRQGLCTDPRLITCAWRNAVILNWPPNSRAVWMKVIPA